mgnify:FL=1
MLSCTLKLFNGVTISANNFFAKQSGEDSPERIARIGLSEQDSMDAIVRKGQPKQDS